MQMKAQTDIYENLGFYFKKGKVGCYFEVHLVMLKSGNFKEYVTIQTCHFPSERKKQVREDNV